MLEKDCNGNPISNFPPFYAKLQIKRKSKPFIENLEGSIFAWLFVQSVGRSVICHGGDNSDVTLAFEDAQSIQTLMDDEQFMMDDGRWMMDDG